MDTTYNGWRNHATWAIGLHLMDTVAEWIIDDPESWGKDDDTEKAAELFQDLLEEQLELSGLLSFPLLHDLLDTWDIDWHALAQHALNAAGVNAPVPA